jgi:predicted small secreted protein
VLPTVVGIVCLVICCWYVRRLYRRRKSQSKVKKFSKNDESIDGRMQKYKYNKTKNSESTYKDFDTDGNKVYDFKPTGITPATSL